MAVAKAVLEMRKKRKKYDGEWYGLRHILGHFNWAMIAVLLGGREAGKSYSVTNFFVDQFVENGNPFNWIRLTDESARRLLTNNAEKLVDPDIRRKYNLDLYVNAGNVYNVTKRAPSDEKTGKQGKILKKVLMCRVLSASTFYNDKGSGLFDKDFLKMHPNWWYNICCDEFEREKGEKNTFDITYALVNQIENLIRSTKERVRIIFVGNTLEEASDLLSTGLGFLPEQFGTYKLKKKRAVIEYIEPSEKYLTRRKGTVADILMGNVSNFTNKIETDRTLISKQKLIAPMYIIKFSKEKDHWFTVWNNNIVARYNNERKPVKAMRPYIDEQFMPDIQKQIFEMFDARVFRYRDLVTFKLFQHQLYLLKPRKIK